MLIELLYVAVVALCFWFDFDFVALVPLQIQQIIENGGIGLQKIIQMKTVDELRFDLNVKLMKFRRFRIENGHINNSTSGEKSKKGFFKKIFS